MNEMIGPGEKKPGPTAVDPGCPFFIHRYTMAFPGPRGNPTVNKAGLLTFPINQRPSRLPARAGH
jgi:hypothetical protein